MTGAVTFTQEPGFDADDFIAVLQSSGLAERRPVRDAHRIQRMIEQADILLVARDQDGQPIGIARALTDYSYCCYLSDLAVDAAWQGKGIGRELIARTHAAAGPECTLILLSAPAAMTYYPKIGLEKPDTAFVIPRKR